MSELSFHEVNIFGIRKKYEVYQRSHFVINCLNDHEQFSYPLWVSFQQKVKDRTGLLFLYVFLQFSKFCFCNFIE